MFTERMSVPKRRTLTIIVSLIDDTTIRANIRPIRTKAPDRRADGAACCGGYDG